MQAWKRKWKQSSGGCGKGHEMPYLPGIPINRLQNSCLSDGRMMDRRSLNWLSLHGGDKTPSVEREDVVM